MKKITSSLMGAMLLTALLNTTVYANADDVSIVNDVMDQAKAERLANEDNPFNNFRKEITAQYAADGLKVKPNDPQGPYTLEGNKITYNTVDGAYEGQGDMKVTHNFSRIEADHIVGNMKAGKVDINAPTEFMQLEDPKVDLKAATAQYDYQEQKGKLTDVEGRIDRNYVKGEEVILEGGAYVLNNGIITRCSSKKPPYYIQVDKVVVTKDVATLYKPRFVLHGKVIYARDIYVVKLNQPTRERRQGTSAFPFKIRYSSRNGVTLGYNQDWKLRDKLFAYGEFRYSTKKDFHNTYGIAWENGPVQARIESGKFEDSNNRWLKKRYSFIYDYNHRLGDSPFRYRLHNEYGLWKEDNIEAHHREHVLTLYRDALKLDKAGDLVVYPYMGYKLIKDSKKVADNEKRGFFYSATVVNKFSPAVVGYAGFHYTRTDARNTLFKFGENDYAKEIALGAGIELTPIDRLIVASEFDASKAMSLQNLDYYWYHDFKFMASKLKYEQKNKRISIHFDFYDF